MNMNEPLVSVCIGTYNRERYIRDCIDSVLAQTYAHIEIIVVDDASTDRTLRILQEYGDRIRLIRRDVNSKLPAVPRNQAIKLAQGELIAFLDSDDRWSPEKTRKQVDFLADHPSVMLVHLYCRLMDAEGGVGDIRHKGAVPATGYIFKDILRHFTIVTSAIMIRRKWFDNNALFSELKAHRAREDLELCLRVARSHPIGFIPEALAYYRRAETGISQASASWRARPRDIPALMLAYNCTSLWRDRISAGGFREIIWEACAENAISWRDQQFPLRSIWAVLQGLKVTPFNARIWSEGARSIGRMLFPRRRSKI